MYPHERSLVEKLKGRPFALIGVNSDKDLTTARKAVEKNGLNWRSFWSGPAGTNGPIPSRWNVKGWPTIYLLDHEGKIRSTNPRGDELDQMIEKLLTEVPSRQR